MSSIQLRKKVQGLYDLVGERGLYVNTNHDVFLNGHNSVKAGHAQQYEFFLLNPKGKAYASPLLLATLTSLLNHGTMLITGAPGIGKTTGAEIAGHFFTGTPLDEILESTIQGHPQQTEEKMIARFHTGKLVKDGEESILPRKFLKCKVKLIDEINRLDPDKWSIILRLIDTGKAVYGDTLLEASQGPLFATANYTDAGTFEMPPPGLDRFDVAAVVTSPQPWDLSRIYSRSDEKLNGGLQKLLEIPQEAQLSDNDFAQIRREISALPKSAGLDMYLNFVLATTRFSEAASDDPARMTKGNAWSSQEIEGPHFTDHPSVYTRNELSVRTARAIQRYARALAWFAGDTEVGEGHVKTIFPYATWHKLQPSEKMLQENPKFANDRIAFAKFVLDSISNEWETKIKGEPTITVYNTALKAVQDPGADQNRLYTIASNAINKICEWDNPYALVLAKSLETEYNTRMMKQ
jgi:MoxR-like ATPase